MKVHQITFVLVVGLVVTLCLMFGCKDKAEANFIDPDDVIIETYEYEPDYPIEIIISADTTLGEWATFKISEDNEIVCDNTRENWLNVMYKAMSGKEPTDKVTLRFEELNEPIIAETVGDMISFEGNPAKYGDIKVVTLSEPNEPIKPDTSKLKGGLKIISELIEYYEEPKENE